MGQRAAFSMLGGALAAWALLGPVAVSRGWVASVPYNGTARAWCATPRVEAATIDSWEGGAPTWPKTPRRPGRVAEPAAYASSRPDDCATAALRAPAQSLGLLAPAAPPRSHVAGLVRLWPSRRTGVDAVGGDGSDARRGRHFFRYHPGAAAEACTNCPPHRRREARRRGAGRYPGRCRARPAFAQRRFLLAQRRTNSRAGAPP